MMEEPRVHSHITDGLFERHPLAHETVWCTGDCGKMLHAHNNECMQAWIETDRGNFCLACFAARHPDGVLLGGLTVDEQGLPVPVKD